MKRSWFITVWPVVANGCLQILVHIQHVHCAVTSGCGAPRAINPPLRNRNRAAGWRCLWSGSPSLSQTWSGLQKTKQIRDVTREEWQSYSRRPAGIRRAPWPQREAGRSGEPQLAVQTDSRSWYPDLHQPLCPLGKSPGLGSVHVFRRAVR